MPKNLMQAKIKVQYSSFQRLALITLDNVRTNEINDDREDVVISLGPDELKDLLRKLINKCVVPR